MDKIYMCIDLKSFYASVECRERGLDPLNTNLVVADESRTEKTICLAVSPSLKAYGLSGRCRLFEAIQKVKEVNYKRRKENHYRPFNGKSYIDSELKSNSNLELDFIKASSYKEKTYSEGDVDIQDLLDINIKNKDVLIVDDIIDTGYTLNEIITKIENRGAKSVKLCTLFNKSERRKVEVNVDFYGFDIPNEFIVGYGLDINQKYRNLPYIGKVKQLIKGKD